MSYEGKTENDALADRRNQGNMGFNEFDLPSLDVITEVTEWNLLNTPEMPFFFLFTCAMTTVFRPDSNQFVLPLP